MTAPTLSLSADATLLLERARHLEHAVDLYLAPGAVRSTADRLVEILHRAPAEALSERALWNLLFAAGELSLRVDVYRAHELFRAAVARVKLADYEPTDPRAAAVEMCFDFFFAREGHPLLPLRATEVLAAMSDLLSTGPRPAIRAAIHGLGHLLRCGGGAAWAGEADQLLVDYLAGRVGKAPDATLAGYAEVARAGSMR